ncbi:uncharacterized protein PAC_04589 [Phialocephala subalpina]|uniref:Uncharacterized protein n=1 Tax=Phialocephala subalpina TaxID=576137 RepID=A0A1L7WPK3_9HELO|nr:uncharacterized protein PAC_04589 [Phialocephala subalpina]
MVNAITFVSDEEAFVPAVDKWEDDIDTIRSYYNEEMLEGMDAADASRRHDLVVQWYEWCDRKYPGTSELKDWENMASAAGEDIDIRLLMRANPHAGYAIMLFLEACYAVDKALCGTDMEALAMVKMWHMPQEMRAYKYLLSEEMMQWWARELAELENEIKSPVSNRVSLSWRVRDLSRCLARLEAVLDCGEGIGTSIWTTMEEISCRTPPAGLDDGIYNRAEQLIFSVKILSKILERDEGAVVSEIAPLASHSSIDSGGIRRRIPRAASPSTNEHDLLAGQTPNVDEENITPASDVASSARVDSLLGATPSTPDLYDVSSLFWLALKRVETFVIRYKAKRFLAWFIHKETVFVLFVLSVAMSAYFMAWSAKLANSQPTTPGDHSPFADSSFLGNLSQAILSNLSIYLIIVATAHEKSGGLHYQSWLWLLLALSFISSVLGLSLYSAVPSVSIIFLWIAAFSQVVIPVLLITMAGKSETEKEDDVESHRD